MPADIKMILLFSLAVGVIFTIIAVWVMEERVRTRWDEKYRPNDLFDTNMGPMKWTYRHRNPNRLLFFIDNWLNFVPKAILLSALILLGSWPVGG